MFKIRANGDGFVSLVGELDMEQAERLLEWAGSNLDGQPEIVLDCSALTFLDSSGIRAILMLASWSFGTVVIRCPPPNVRRVLGIADVGEDMGVRIEA
jgi:anti-anti-sigma factor